MAPCWRAERRSGGSVAHERLDEIILDERWLKVVTKYLHFRSTADLESFHNHILMYASKCFSFSPPVYAAGWPRLQAPCP